MMILIPCLYALILTCHAVLHKPPRTYVEHEHRDLIEHEHRDLLEHDPWLKRDRPLKDMVIPVSIGLNQNGLEQGHDILMDISDPKSANYGHHYTVDQLIDLFAPSQDSVDAVYTWINKHGRINTNRISLSNDKQWLKFNATTAELEALLNTTFYNFKHVAARNKIGIACDRYYVPRHIQEHVDFVTPGIHPMEYKAVNEPVRDPVHKYRPHSDTMNPGADQIHQAHVKIKSCPRQFDPKCIRKLYNITDVNEFHKGNKLGLYEVSGVYNPKTLNSFFRKFTSIPQGTHPIFKKIDGAPGLNSGRGHGMFESAEQNLDLQLAYPLAYPNEMVNFQVDDPYYEFHFFAIFGIFSSFLNAIDGSYCSYKAYGIKGDTVRVDHYESKNRKVVSHIDPKYPDRHGPHGYKGDLQCGEYTPTPVISISAGVGEGTLPVNYQRRQCNEFMKLGLHGITVLAATGDEGVRQGYARGPSCFNSKHLTFGANSPVNCPYITTVGATFTLENFTEFAAHFSSGGFSNIFPRPKYQDTAVEEYFSKHAPPYPYYNTSLQRVPPPNTKGRYNRAGRAYPDVAAIGRRVLGYLTPEDVWLWTGTSVSTPLFAGIINRINSARLAAGKKTVGFINPVLYANPQAFNDITLGHNRGCHSRGFQAEEGWDPASGLGTPNYPLLKEVFMKLP